MPITRSNFINILKQKDLIDFTGKGATDENFNSVEHLARLLQKYGLCVSKNYAEDVALNFFEFGTDAAFSDLQFTEEETVTTINNKLKVILEDHTLDLKDWSKFVNLIKNIESIVNQLQSKSATELDNFIKMFLSGKSIPLQGGSIQGTKSYDAHAPEKSKIKDGWIPFEVKPNPGKGNNAEYRLYGIYKDYIMIILYKSVKNSGQSRENSVYDKFGIIANEYITNLAKNLILIENICLELSYNITEDIQDRSLNFMQWSKRFTYTSVEDLMNDKLTLFEELELANARQDLDLYAEGVDDGYAGVDKKGYINDEYHRGYAVGKDAKAKEARLQEVKAKFAAYKADKQKI